MDNPTQESETNFIIEFMKHLKDLIKEPPYLMFYFVSSILLIISLIWRENYFGFFFILLIYSMVGVVWRHATKDLRGRLKERYPDKFNKINLWLTGIYQLLNLVFIIVLIAAMALFATSISNYFIE